MKKPIPVVFVIAAVLIIIGTVYGGATAARQALSPAAPRTVRATCEQPGTEYIVAIKDDQLGINDIEAKLCDKLTIVNEDDRLRLVAFGIHEKHKTYNGVTEQTLEQGQRFSVTLNETGSYTFHDHLRDTFTGRFTVY